MSRLSYLYTSLSASTPPIEGRCRLDSLPDLTLRSLSTS
jgi:hypothetical protein